MVATCFFWVVWRRRAAPSGLCMKVGLFICCEIVDWSRVSNIGVGWNSESVSGERVIVIKEGMIDCHARHGAAACL